MVVLLVALTFIAVIVLVAVTQSVRDRGRAVSPDLVQAGSGILALPPDYRLSSSHIWIRELSTGDVRIGADELIHRFIGTPDKIDLKKVGDIVSRGEPLAVVGAGGRELFVRSPVNGQVSIVNEEIISDPDAVSRNPYGSGWFYVLRPLYTNSGIEWTGTRSGVEAVSWLASEFNRLRDFVHRGARSAMNLAPTMADGGMPILGIICRLDQDTVSRFEEEFLVTED